MLGAWRFTLQQCSMCRAAAYSQPHRQSAWRLKISGIRELRNCGLCKSRAGHTVLLQPDSPRKLPSEKLGLQDHGVNVLTNGQLTERKGQHAGKGFCQPVQSHVVQFRSWDVTYFLPPAMSSFGVSTLTTGAFGV